MNDQIKDFIEEYIYLIENNEWEKVYEKAQNELRDFTGKFTEAMFTVDIHPEEYLIEIPANFLRWSDIQEFIIPRNIKKIARYAFYYCTSLTSVTIPDSVISIGDDAFRSCYSLTNITIPNSVTNIGKYMFLSCTSLKSVTIPESVISIGEMAFYGCTSLTSIEIPDLVTSIGKYAFYGCTSLESIVIPDSVMHIGEGAFMGCKNLDIRYTGTKSEWKDLATRKFNNATYTCTCKDGVVKKPR